MEAKVCIETRRSVRRFTEAPVGGETVRELIRLASFAPSWKNTQTVRWTAVTEREHLRRLGEEAVMGFAGNRAILEACPLLLIESCVTGRSGYERDGSFSTAKGDRWEMFDAGIAAQTLCLAARDMGLGTVILGVFDPEAVARLAALPAGQTVSALIAVGCPAQEPVMPKRKSPEELLNL